jgi:sugar transferase (PEP-CTERM/EpsH1 system associated)
MNGQPIVIAHVIHRLDVGGMENGLVNLINSLPESRYRHVIICLTDYTDFSERITAGNVRILALHKREGKDLAVFLRMWKTLRELRPTIVHTRNLGTIDMVIPAALAGVRHRIHGEHGWDMTDLHGENRKYRYLRRLCGLFITRYITVSKDLARWLHERLDVPEDRIDQIHNGVDSLRFRPAAAGREEIGAPGFASPESVVIGYVGRMAAVKNPLGVVQAFLYLWQKLPRGREQLRLVLIGDGPLRAELENVFAGADALGSVWFAGERDDIPRLLRGMDVFVMPSLNEGISNTILEAMATGLPVVATDVGGNPELVRPDRTGYLVCADDSLALASAIRRYVEHPELRREHGRAARDVIESEFCLRSMVGRYMRVYETVTGNVAAG